MNLNQVQNMDDNLINNQAMIDEPIQDLEKTIIDSLQIDQQQQQYDADQQYKFDIDKVQMQTLDQLSLKQYAGISCFDYLNQRQENIKDIFISSGIKEIDNLLRNGLRTGIITEIYGADGSCKTSLALQFTFNVKKYLFFQLILQIILNIKAILSEEHNQKAYCIYLSTTKKPHQQRINQIIEGIKQRNKNLTADKILNSMDQFIEISVPSILRFQEFISSDMQDIQNQNKKIRMVVIDNIYDLASQIEDFKEKQSFLFQVTNILKKFAHQNNTAIVIVNNVVAQINDNSYNTSSFQGNNNIMPALGHYWTHLINERLQLSIQNDYVQNTQIKIRQLSVKISPRLPQNSIKLIPDNFGIQCIS